jgi:hypothetical protein
MIALAKRLVHPSSPMTAQYKACQTMRVTSWFIAAGVRHGNNGLAAILSA